MNLFLYLWPLIRHFVHVSRRCPRCLVTAPECDDYYNVCYACGRYVHTKSTPTSDSLERIEEVLRRGVGTSGCHVLLLISGGKDSAYMLHRIRHEYPELQILALLVATPFLARRARRNAIFTAKKAGVPLAIVASDNEFVTSYRQAFLSGRECLAVDRSEGLLINSIGRRIAKAADISLMLIGLTSVQRTIYGLDAADESIAFPLIDWDVSEQQIVTSVRKNRLLPCGDNSPLATNSELVPAMIAIDFKRRGYSSFESEFARMVREGRADRKEWLHRFECLEWLTRRGWLDKSVRRTLDKLELTMEDVLTCQPAI